MESKKINRQFNSLFWGIIYVMPLLILVITYFGYFNMYKENQNYNIESNTTIIPGEEYLSCSTVPNEGYVEKVYFNTKLSVEETVDLLNSIGNDEIYFICFDGFTNLLIATKDNVDYSNLDLYFWQIFDMNNNIYFSEYSYSNGEGIVDFIGWNPNVIFPIEINNNVIPIFDMNGEQLLFGTYNDKLSSLFSLTPFEYIKNDDILIYNDTLLIPNKINKDGVESTEYLSLFDLSIMHTINTFDGFVFEPLHNTFTSVLPKINFSNDTLIAQLVILIFTWFVQGMFIHIIIDTITLVPKMYHKMMERWLG